MSPQKNYIVFLCYGDMGILHECAYSLLSLSRLYTPEELSGTEIWLYTDKPEFFRSFSNCLLPLHYRQVNDDTIKRWRGAINFSHRVKIEALKDLVTQANGSILYVDADSVFTHRIDKVWQDIQAGQLYMHVMEGIVSERSNRTFKKLDDHLRRSSTMSVNGIPAYDMPMWNAGVLGFNTAHAHILDKVLSYTDNVYPRYPKHIVEQFAFSLFFAEAGNIKTAAPYIMHYWNMKEMRAVLRSFFAHFGNTPWEEMVQYSKLIQMHVHLQEKGNFLDSRSLAKVISKKQWVPAGRDWEVLKKQL